MQQSAPLTQETQPDSVQTCALSVMDASDPDITFDLEGISNYWKDNKVKLQTEVISGDRGLARANEIAEKIKIEAKNREYDCIIGLSGGVDSSFIAYWVRKLGLNPLAVHMDNGWDSELAVSNIEKIVRKLDIDLHTEVLDWPEFRDLQRSFFFASVPNCEMPTDHAIVATLFALARKFGIRHIISGSNVVTEGIVQRSAGHDNKDWSHIADIQKRFGSLKLRSYPHLSGMSFARAILIDRIQFVPLLNYLDYNWSDAKQVLAKELGWREYQRKHGESLFTRFFQEYYLPQKFGVDKRRIHFSSLICAGQMTRTEALELLDRPLYTAEELAAEIEFIQDKLQFTDAEFSAIMSAQPKMHSAYRTSSLFRNQSSSVYRWARKNSDGSIVRGGRVRYARVRFRMKIIYLHQYFNTPTTIAYSGTSDLTKAPAPTNANRPISTPQIIVQLAPNVAPCLTIVS